MSRLKIYLLVGFIVIATGILLVVNHNKKQLSYIADIEKTIERLEAENNRYEEEYNSLNDTTSIIIEDNENQIASISSLLDSKQEEIDYLLEEQKQLFDEWELRKTPDALAIEKLRLLGIEDYSIIEESLVELGADIIMNEGVLGGTMHFTSVRVLNERWAYGTFEDGHIMGRGIYEYIVNEDNSLVWEVVLEYLD